MQLLEQGNKPKQIQEITGVSIKLIKRWAISPSRSRKSKYLDELKQRCVSLYREGKTMLEVARLTGVPAQRVKDWAKKAGVRGVNTGGRPSMYSQEVKQDCLRLRAEGKSCNQIEELTGINAETVYKWVRKSCMKLSSEGKNPDEVAKLTGVDVKLVSRWLKSKF
ncbi:hypothetical protein [Trichocoleus sp. FACHB-262]|uniref:hypothetical protein n=1 Tax=Trichocoleus sp. FACHB-262 TaxID=2692869 RepID=UPI00168932E1|nr:hypothetical protein [Trichocoleus sp. FACHB-262]MBD2124758.1 hypothetical protein [Trichocoleus sp. FACHB-262]